MAESSSSNFQIPWPTMIAAVTALGGLLWYLGPAHSSRPAGEPSSQPLKPPGRQELDARLWQDPIRIAAQAYAADSGSAEPRETKWWAGNHYEHSIDALPHQHQNAHRTVLPVMLEQGPYSDAIEHRRRERNAVINGLNQAFFVPDDQYHIGYVTVDDWKVFNEAAEQATVAAPRPLLVPYEWFRRQGASSEYVLVLWLDEGEFADSPLIRLQTIMEKLKAMCAPTKIIGPRGSSALEQLEADIRMPGADYKEDLWKEVEIYSPTATVPEEIIHRRIANESSKSASQPTTNAEIFPTSAAATKPTAASVKIHRTVSDDFDLSKALVKELKLRGVDTAGGDYVAIVSEWDTFYGRMLPVSFVAAAAGIERDELPDVYARRIGEPHAMKATAGLHCDLFTYLRGIDGQTATGSESSSKNAKSGDSISYPNKNPLQALARTPEAPEGDNQFDYLRRMVDELKRRDAEARSKSGSRGGLKAIGVLGSDVYDKLIVLQFLRPEFPDAIVFTTDLDARLGSATESSWAHNLIVASSFDLQIATNSSKELGKSSPFEEDPPPFRDSGQTAVYCATLAAFNVNSITPERLSKQPVCLFEIGCNGPVRLGTDDSESDAVGAWSIQPKPESWTPWWTVTRMAAMIALAVLALALWLGVRPSRHIGKGLGWQTPKLRVVRWWWSSPGNRFLVAGLAVCVLFVVLILVAAGGTGVPLMLFEGVSLWPSEFIRLIAISLAVWFMVTGYDAIQKADCRIEDRYWLGADGSGSAVSYWKTYRGAGLWKPRSWRIFCMSLTYILCSTGIALLLGVPSEPTRGTASVIIGWSILFCDGVLFVLLSFFVVDATLLARQLIRSVSRCRAGWPDKCLSEFKKATGLIDDDAADLAEIRFIAQLTSPVMHLIYYPFIVLTLMIVARLSIFGNSSWAPSLIVIYALNSLIAVYAAHVLRRAAEEARSRTLDRLGLTLVSVQGQNPARIEQLKMIMEEIRNTREGAFASFGNNPIIGAVLLPASVGVLSFIASLSQSHG